MQRNLDLAAAVIEALLLRGVKDVVICAGSFNSALFRVFHERSGLRLYHHFEERAAAFFALGLSKGSLRPTVVCTTSGTAVAECLPAVIEAAQSQHELIVVSADRELALSESGYPQAIEQSRLLESHATSLDVKIADDLGGLETVAPQLPIHLNVRFKEPIMEAHAKSNPLTLEETETFQRKLAIYGNKDYVSSFLKKHKRPLIVLEGIPFQLRSPIKKFLIELGAPILAEARSGLREDQDLQSQLTSAHSLHRKTPSFDSVLRIGQVPTSDLWRALERDSRFQEVAICNLSPKAKFPGLSRACICEPIEGQNWDVDTSLFSLDRSWCKEFAREEQELDQKITQLLVKYPKSEAALVHAISLRISGQDFVYLGNSLPIREWNLFASKEHIYGDVDANRGANGIDGQLATFLGSATQRTSDSWALLGDLTFLYDCSALSLLPQLQESTLRVIVLQNRGGRIFEQLPYFPSLAHNSQQSAAFLNQHQLGIATIAEGFGWPTIKSETGQLQENLPKQVVVEIDVHESENTNFLAQYKDLIA